jgi:dihydroxyacetone kinase
MNKINNLLTKKIAEQRAEQTAQMEARAGRASYTSAQQQNQPDPGATALAIWFRAVYEQSKK